MLTHYLKIAFRNLTKYKMQTIISIIGLAVGFVCFALSTLWLRYERSFDAFHPNAHNIFVVTTPDVNNPRGVRLLSHTPAATYLRETFPDVKNASNTAAGTFSRDIEWNGVEMSVDVLNTTEYNIFEILNIRTLAGYLSYGTRAAPHFAISASKARELFGDENPVGQIFTPLGDNARIVAIVSDMPRPSNFRFDFIDLPNADWPVRWGSGSGATIMELHPNINKEAFLDRLRNYTIEGEMNLTVSEMDVIPLTKLRHQNPNVRPNVKYEHLLLFSLAGLLVILCALFNYFTLFFSRFRLRQKEFALRTVCGATFKSLFSMLATEFLAVMLFASVLGLLITFLFQPTFLELSEIYLPLTAIFGETLLYWLGITLLALLSFFVMLLVFRKRSLSASIRKGKNTVSRKASVVVQLIISIGFAFCTIVMIKQLQDLTRPGNLGFEFQNTASIMFRGSDAPPDSMAVYHRLVQMPEITEVVVGFQTILGGGGGRDVNSWDGKTAADEPFRIDAFRVSYAFSNFHRLQLVEGEFLTDSDPLTMVMINEEAKRRFGWTEAVGKTFNDFTVKGVIRNTYTRSPTVPVQPTFYHQNVDFWWHSALDVIFRYQGVPFSEVENRIRAVFAEEFPHISIGSLRSADVMYAGFIQSERALMRLLGFVSLVCILISVFGFFSLVSLTCEERRKEIAIRKVNGATIHDIVGIFFKEYGLLLVIGALIAFPIGYYIMRRWLEQYVIQTSIDAWIYVAILFALTTVIVLCVGWRVWMASRENPADVVKSE